MAREGVDVGLCRSGLWLRTEEGKGDVLSVVGAAEYQKILYLYFFDVCKIPVHIKFFTAASTIYHLQYKIRDLSSF